jgi:CheY-like chemotaxis protein
MTTFCILVVDDDEDFLSGIIRQLRKKFDRITIKGASSGVQALAVIEETLGSTHFCVR